jgi:hypothetical protein
MAFKQVTYGEDNNFLPVQEIARVIRKPQLIVVSTRDRL